MSTASDRLEPLELAAHVVFGRIPKRLPEPAVRITARAAVEQAILPALRRPPCLVGFSGGRDSSALLAVAASVARREGLELPVPVTTRYPAAPASLESDWQEQVIERLALSDWVRLTLGAEADLIGPIARDAMTRHGLPYPYNLHLLAPMLDEARDGSFVTGLGGDEALAPGSRELAVLAGRIRPAPRDALRVAAALAPAALRRRRGARLAFPWLTDEANRRLGETWGAEVAGRPLRWDRRLRDWWRSRYVHLAVDRIDMLGRDRNVVVHHPFASAGFVAALAREGGWRGYRSRAAALERLFGDVVPAEVARRADKASFDAVLWNDHSRAFAAALGEAELERALAALGLEGVVDPRALAAHWSTPMPLANSFLLLQACRLVTPSS